MFVFLYNIDKPGFSYFLLPELRKYVLPVMLREGTGDRNTRREEHSVYLIRQKEWEQLSEIEYLKTRSRLNLTEKHEKGARLILF